MVGFENEDIILGEYVAEGCTIRVNLIYNNYTQDGQLTISNFKVFSYT